MKIRWRTISQILEDRREKGKDWNPVFLFFPRRARDSRGRLQQYLVVGRCVRRIVSRDADDCGPYVWGYQDTAEAAKEKLGVSADER